MRLRPLALAFCAAFAASPVAWAQMQLTSSTANQPLETMSSGVGRTLSTHGIASGLKLGDEAILHAGVFADVGYDSNVFYGSGSQATSAVMHVTPTAGNHQRRARWQHPVGHLLRPLGGSRFCKNISPAMRLPIRTPSIPAWEGAPNSRRARRSASRSRKPSAATRWRPTWQSPTQTPATTPSPVTTTWPRPV
jgi:hypothetical protein